MFTGPYAIDRTGSQQTFGGVSCPSASQCTAVDISGNEVTFDPASGTVNPAGSRPAPGGSPLNAVSCPAASQCTAVDDSGREVTFDPVSGAVNAAGTRRIDSRSLTSVSCPSITQCTAVDDHGHEATFDPASGSVNVAGIAKVDAVRVPDPSPSAYTTPAFSVACPSASQCTVVDFAGNEVTFDPVSGTVNAAGAKSVGRGQKLELNAVACPSGSQCTAADDSGREVTFDPITGTVNAVGVRLVDTSPIDRSGFSGRFGPSLSCPAASQCITVDGAGNEMTFDPTSGAVNAARIEPRTAAHQYLGGVSCPPPGSQCTAVDGSGSEVTFDPASGVVNAAGIKPVGSGILNAVACPSSARCTAVDQGGDEVTFDPASGRPNRAGVDPLRGGVPVEVSMHRGRSQHRG